MWLLLSFLKKSLSSQEITAEWIWYGYNNKSKILLATCKESVIKIYLMLGIAMAWFDSTFNCKELSFNGSDINCIVNHFNNWPIVQVNVWYWGSNAIFYTSIWNDNQGVGIVRSVDSNVVEITYMILDIMSSDIKEESIWVGIYKSLF